MHDCTSIATPGCALVGFVPVLNLNSRKLQDAHGTPATLLFSYEPIHGQDSRAQQGMRATACAHEAMKSAQEGLDLALRCWCDTRHVVCHVHVFEPSYVDL